MSPWNILFVDDDRDFLDAQSAFFGSRGHTVHTAESSQEALDFLETNTPDIIFIDLMMERYDSGFRLTYELRKRENFKDTPLIMLSGVARETGERFDQEGKGLLSWTRLDRFVDKPATGKQLLAIAEEYLGAPDDHTGTGQA
jgi:two-component system response regulator VicR